MPSIATSPIVIRRCELGGEALALIAKAWPDTERATQLQALLSAIAGQKSGAILLQAECGQRLQGAVLAQVMPGKVALVTPPQTCAETEVANSAMICQLLTQLDRELSDAGVQLAQALLATDDARGAGALRSGGYEHAADLIYLFAESGAFPEHELSLPLDLVPVCPTDEARLIGVVEATYERTLDCPRLDGLRGIGDVLAGYRVVGESQDRLWYFVRFEGVDVGCLILADHASSQQWEIVYVGLVPGVRGRGWGLELTRHTQWLARQAGRERLVLAVDAANEPALAMYAAAGFRAWDRRATWIKPLPAASDCGEST